MTTQATGTFTIDTWEEEPYDEQDGIRLSRTRVTKTFHGQIEGHSTAELLMAYVQGNPGAYVGFERIVAHVHDRSGSFVLHHNASNARGVQSASWSIVQDSGTGDLTGLRGEARITLEPDGRHTFTLDYDLDA